MGQDKNLVLPDGSAFKIDNDYENLTEDLLLSLQNYKLNDLYFIRKADTKEYILTCEDGKKYYFDGTYGNITKMEDRFGNSISFEYEEIDFYRGTFFDFLYNPTTYTVKMNLLKEITDSTGRIINFDYDISSGLYGQEMETIKISMDNITYATITLDNVKSYNGRISTLRSIKDGEERSTDFTYEEELSYINEDTHQANGSAFLLTSIKHPTGGTTQYEYLKSKRTAQYWVPTGSGSMYTYNYDTFKVSSRIEPDKTLQYHYVNDYSGYPYSHLDTDLYKNPTGYIADSSMTYQTIVEDFDKATIYTFDYRHKNIEKQTYVNRPFTNRFSPALGRDNSRVIVNGKIYQIGISKQNLKQIYIYILPTDINIVRSF